MTQKKQGALALHCFTKRKQCAILQKKSIIALSMMLLIVNCTANDQVFETQEKPRMYQTTHQNAQGKNAKFYNPYNIDQLYDLQDKIKGFLYAEKEYSPQKHAYANQQLMRNLADNHDLGINPEQDIPYGINNKFINNVSYSFFQHEKKLAMLTLTDANEERYSIPSHIVNKHGVVDTMRLDMLGLQVYEEPFSFSYTDPMDSDNVFIHSNQSTFVFADKYMQIDLQLPSQRMYGFGERTREFPLGEGTWTMWARDNQDVYDDGTGGLQGYGVHPFLLTKTKKGDFMGLYFRNSNAQSPLIKFKEDGGSTLSYITTGGQIEIYFFLHGSVKSILKSYHNRIGRPYLPPFWALGWNQASWGYTNQTQVEDMIDSYEEADIPLEVVWLDIPYMLNFTDFTVDEEKFPDLLGLSEDLHNKRRQLVAIIDAAISADNPQLGIYQEAYDKDIFIISNMTGEPLMQNVWPSQAAFIDWFHENATAVWARGLMELYEQIEYDGLWLDMNEATGFCSGECDYREEIEFNDEYNNFKSNAKLRAKRRLMSREDLEDLLEENTDWFKTFNSDEESTFYLPFIPGYDYQGNLDSMTLSLNATHPSNGDTEYNLHSLYGIAMTKATQDFLTKNETYPNQHQRAFILSRSTFAGSGKYGSHWLGDNWRDWSYMNYSISGIMNFNMFGIPHVGADVCGFAGTYKDDEMCGRWIQLATFYPFARHHQHMYAPSSEPYTLDPYWKSVARASIYDRYQYLRLMYTCLWEVGDFGGTCFDPLLFHYPEDENTYENTEESFIVADALKVSPILQPGVTDTYTSYFPKGRWVSMIDYADVVEGGKRVELQNQTTVNVHLRDGKLIPFQDNSDFSINTTSQLIERPVSIVANRNINGTATGSLLLERGRSKTEMDRSQYEYYLLSVQQNTLIKQLKKGTHGAQKGVFKELLIVDAEDLATVDFACMYDSHINVKNISVEYLDDKKTLRIWSEEPVYFHQFRQINFGSNENRDLNLCGPNSYHYRLRDGKEPDLSKSVATFVVDHEANTLPSLKVTLSVISGNTLNVKWTFEKTPTSWHDPFEIPDEVVHINRQERPYSKLSSYVTLRDKPFEIHALTGSGEFVYTIHQMLLAKHLNVISVGIQTTRGDDFTGIIGLGQRVNKDIFYDYDGVYSIWSSGDRMPKETGRPPGKQGYGSHPFYMFKHSEDNWVGVYQNLAAGQDYYIKNNKETGKVNITMFAAGGLQDVFIIVDSSPANVANGFYDLIGKPVLTPFWILGWHQCRWGYKTLQDIKEVVNKYTEYDLPLDSQWSDIDYLYNNRDFEYDPVRYEGLPEFVQELHKQNKHYVPITDAGVAAREWQHYETYKSGKEKDIFIKINDHQDLVGQVWPNDAVFPDWFHPEAANWWQDQIQRFHDNVQFDGLWLDMNEAANDCYGVCYPYQQVDEPIEKNIKYVPLGREFDKKSLSLDAYHANGYREIDTHSLFGTMEAIATNGWFIKNNKRPMIISRSTFSGVGKYGSNWLGDDYPETWYMAQSVTGIMMMNMFGIPITGSDLCGFDGDTNGELCARWYMVAAFQPFSRNHNAHHKRSQEPYVFSDEYYEENISYTDIIRGAMRVKYSIVKYYYSQLFMHTQFGGAPVYKPLFFEYPNDMDAFKNVSQNLMLGDSLKVSVMADEVGVNQTQFYFPEGTWCNLFYKSEKCFKSNGEFQTRRTKAYDFYVHIKEGKIVPFQDVLESKVMNVKELQDRPVDFHINGKANAISQGSWMASGTYINDDGETLELDGNYNRYDVVATGTTNDGTTSVYIMFSTQKAYNYDPKDDTDCSAINQSDFLGEIHIHNAAALQITNAFYTTASFVNQTETLLDHSYYDKNSDRLIVKQPDIPLCLPSITKITLTNYD